MKKEHLRLLSTIFGIEIRKIRIRSDKTLESFTEYTGIGPNHIGEIERGIKIPRLDTIVKLRNAGVDINKVLDHIIQDFEEEGIVLTKE